MIETGLSISLWADRAFGPATSDSRVVWRALKELTELLEKTTSKVTGHEIVEECADVVIVLTRLAYNNGGDLFEAVDQKMAVNRSREWIVDGTGHGQHKETR